MALWSPMRRTEVDSVISQSCLGKAEPWPLLDTELKAIWALRADRSIPEMSLVSLFWLRRTMKAQALSRHVS